MTPSNPYDRRLYDRTISTASVLWTAWCVLLACVPVVLLIALATSSLRCSGTQQRSWIVTADASLSVAAHGIDTVDQIAAQRYTVEVSRPDANLAAIDARYAPVRIARNLARERLIAAEVALGGGDVGRRANGSSLPDGGCPALVAVRLAREAVTAVGQALAIATAGSAEAPALAEAVRALVDSIASGPTCPAGGQ